ncbi:MAG: response regulator transcription factor [Anaeromyxobacteraceae bacterium]
MTEAPRIRVLLADDHAVLREGVRALLERQPDLEVVGEASDGREAVDAAARLDPDVVVMDVAMPGLGGLEAALELRRRGARARVLVLSQHDDPEYVRRLVRAGAAGYVLKRSAGTELSAAIRAVHRGGLVLDPSVARAAVEPAPGEAGGANPYETLTDREKQVLRLVAEGKSTKDVAAILEIAVKTAMSHREHVMRKLGVHNRTELVRFAIAHGVVRVDAK